MAANSGSFSKTNQPTSRRRTLGEELLFSNLKDYGNEMLRVLVTHAKESEREDIRIRAADRFLCHVLLQPRDGAEESINDSENDVFARAGLNQEQAMKLKGIIKTAMCGLLSGAINEVKEIKAET